jgi:hypothetical protein
MTNEANSEKILAIVAELRHRGVKLWSHDGQLRYRAPRGALTSVDIETIREFRGQILTLLRSHVNLQPAPLAFSQLAHWSLYGLDQCSSIRNVAHAIRTKGMLDTHTLRGSVAEVVRLHGALRTRVVVCDGIPMQQQWEGGTDLLEVEDLSALSPDAADWEIQKQLAELILDPVDVRVGPLFRVRLLSLSANEAVLIVAMEHIISDGFSLTVFWRDLFAAYARIRRGELRSTELPLQFADHSTWQRRNEAAWNEKHGAYWRARLDGCGHVKFRESYPATTRIHSQWGRVPIRIDGELKAQLRQWCRMQKTTLAMSVFTAYVAVVLRWCDVEEAIFQYHIDGRDSPPMQGAIGFFASVLYLRLGLTPEDSFSALAGRAMAEYCAAREHADCGLLAARSPADFMRNTTFNWLPQGALQLDLDELGHAGDEITWTSVTFQSPRIRDCEADIEPSIALTESGDEIVGSVYFSLDRFSQRSMERFVSNFMAFLRVMVKEPQGAVPLCG